TLAESFSLSGDGRPDILSGPRDLRPRRRARRRQANQPADVPGAYGEGWIARQEALRELGELVVGNAGALVVSRVKLEAVGPEQEAREGVAMQVAHRGLASPCAGLVVSDLVLGQRADCGGKNGDRHEAVRVNAAVCERECEASRPPAVVRRI